MRDFKSLRQIEQEDYLMPQILRILQNFGGSATRSEIEKQLAQTDQFIGEDVIYQVKQSSKGNGTFRPFLFPFNFALKNLMFAGYLTYDRSQPVTLTSKGTSADPDALDIENDIRALAKPKWDEKAAQNKARKQKTLQNNISLPDSSTDDLDQESPLDEYRDELLGALAAMSPKKFELFCRALLKAMDVTLDEKKGVSISNDGGIDGFGYHQGDDFRTTRVAIQAKRWAGKVSSPDIDKFRGAMDKFGAEFGVFITNSQFTASAVEASRVGTRAITLIDGDSLAKLVAKYGVYVKPVTTYELGDFYNEP
jgi:restriction system protein